MRYPLLLLILAILIQGCSKDKKYASIGCFSKMRQDKNSHYFVTTYPNACSASVKKITSGLYEYYEWKTVNINKTHKGKTYSTYKTLENDKLKNVSPEEARYLNIKGNKKSNYLFFLDDYRCLYLSKDDERTPTESGLLPLYFDDDQYKPEKAYKQILKGYYSVKGNQIFFDFEYDRHFYVKATLAAPGKIVFDSIYVPGDDGLVRNGYNPPYSRFDSLFDRSSLPVFEVPNQADTFVDDAFQLVFGFGADQKSIPKKNALHEQLLSRHGNEFNDARIVDIRYKFHDDPEQEVTQGERIYRYILNSLPTRQDTFQLPENIGQHENRQGAIVDSMRTW